MLRIGTEGGPKRENRLCTGRELKSKRFPGRATVHHGAHLASHGDGGEIADLLHVVVGAVVGIGALDEGDIEISGDSPEHIAFRSGRDDDDQLCRRHRGHATSLVLLEDLVKADR